MTVLTRTLLPLAAAAAAALGTAGGAQAAEPPACPLMSQPTAAEHPLDGSALVARDPYGGTLPRNRLFFDFSLRGPKAELARVVKVTWAMDGTVVREDPTAPFEWKGVSGSKRRMPAGPHTITVTAALTDGSAHGTSFALTATDCQPVSFWPLEIPQRRGTTTLGVDAAFESDAGEPLATLTFEADRNVVVQIPRSRRGHTIGTLRADGTTYRLTARGRTLLRGKGRPHVTLHPGARRFLRISGLPAGTQHVRVRLAPGVARLAHPRRSFRVTARVTGTRGGHARATGGGRYA